VRLIIVVEGRYDVEFLRRISAILHASDRSLPSLVELETRGQVLLMPIGGGDLSAWGTRLAPLQKREFHLYDREQAPETKHRRKLAAAVNERAGCCGVVTSKRSLENYLHPAAIVSADGPRLEIDDDCQVTQLLAESWSQTVEGGQLPWPKVAWRTRKYLLSRAKRWLNTRAVMHMTSQMLVERGAFDEIATWLTTIRQLAA
jgi:hypothetical protein